jgi:hypothetical protein
VTRFAPIVLAALAAACGGLGNPDLTTGEVRGRIVGGTTAGYVYPVGRPELKAPLAADGSFRVRAPVGASELVLFDGKPVALAAPYGRAGRVAVQVQAAEISELGEQDGAQLPVASAVLAGVRAESGAGCKDPRFQAALVVSAGTAATDQDKVVSSGVPAALLTPLPPGPYQLQVSMAGFRPEVRSFELADSPQTLSFDLTLLVDDEESVRGCEVTSCESSELDCCEAGESCESVGRCYATSSGDASCGMACATSGGSPCQAGLSCTSGGTCQPPAGATCSTYLATLGAACLSDDGCKPAVVNGTCHGADSEHAGYCTAPCDTLADCAGFPLGWTCDGEHHVCQPPHD